MKSRKKIIIFGVIVFLFLICAAVLIKNGILVNPTEKSLSKSQEVPEYDILTWQAQQELDIKNDYAAGSYTFENPYVIVDPYEMNPNTALVIFEGKKAGNIDVEIQGDDEFATLRYAKYSRNTHFEIPIIGLYAGRENIVRLNNQQGDIVQLSIRTDPLPVDFQTYTLDTSIPEKMEPGFTLFIACFENSYTAILDHNAQVRGYLSNRYMAHGTAIIQLKNGHMLSTGDEYKQIPYNMSSLWEFNWLGKLFREYEIPNAVHHNITEMPNGDFLAVSNDVNMFTSGTREDVVIIIDRETGEVKKEYNFRKILDETRDPYHHFHPNIINVQNIDWMHTNGAIFNQDDNSIIVSSPTQSQVVAIDATTSEIRWILGPHEGYSGSSSYLKKYLLSPLGSDFEWQWGQHDPMILPDFDHNPDTMDMLLFDNGQSRSFTEENAINPTKNYSRAVIYRINPKQKTVEQIWQYGKECGTTCYATFLGDADYLPLTGNRIIAFGGQIRANDMPVDDIVGGVFGDLVVNSKVVEVDKAGQVVYSVSVKDNKYTSSAETYQAERINFYSPASFEYVLGQIVGERLGKSFTCKTTDMIKAPVFYTKNMEAIFDRIHLENKRLIVDGRFLFDGKSYLLGRVFFILRSETATYVYAANSSLNSRFFMSLDTTELANGTYQISVVGASREGNDQLSGKMHQGHVKIPYKITVAN